MTAYRLIVPRRHDRRGRERTVPLWYALCIYGGLYTLTVALACWVQS